MIGSAPIWAAGGAVASLIATGVVAAIMIARVRRDVSNDAVRTRLAEADVDSAILEGLARLSRAPNRKAWADIASTTLAALTGTSGAAIVLRAPGTDSMSLAGSSVPLVIRNLEATLREPHGPSARALASGEPVTMSTGELPAWAAAAGFDAGAAIALPFHGTSIGLAYVLGKPWQVPSPESLDAGLRFLGLATSHYTIAGPFATPAAPSAQAAPSAGSASGATAVRSMKASLPHVAAASASTQGQTVTPARLSAVSPARVAVVSAEPRTAAAPVPTMPVETSQRRRIDLPGVALDPRTERCIVDGRAVALSTTEFDLLYALASSRGDVVTAEQLVREVWGTSSVAPSSALDVTIHRVRKKLGRAPGGSELIRTVRGKGYAIALPEPEPGPALASSTASASGRSGSARDTASRG